MGAPKAGTTTLAADLAHHPRVWIPQRKELGYFDIRWHDSTLADYASDFRSAPEGAVLGEATPTYLHASGALERIAETLPRVRLVAILRDPVTRFWSHYWYNRTARGVEQRPPHEAIARNADEYILPGMYASHLRRARALFDDDQLCVLTLDDLAADPDTALDRVHRHLGLDPAIHRAPTGVRNAAYELRSPRLRRVMLRYQLWRRLPVGLGYRLDQWNRRPIVVPEIPDEVRAVLVDVYAADTAALAGVLGHDVPWSVPRSSPPDAPARTT